MNLATCKFRSAAVRLLAILVFLPSVVGAADAATLTYRRVFKSSVPEFIEIQVREDGKATSDIRQLSDDPDSVPFEVGPALRAKIFELAAALHHFQNLDLDVHRRIANLGAKTFRWQQGGEIHEVTFNYTLNAEAAQLMQIFEGLARQQDHLTVLRRRMRYDRLGVNDALLRFESDLNNKLIPEPQRLLSVLEAIAADGRIVDIARERARALIERIKISQHIQL